MEEKEQNSTPWRKLVDIHWKNGARIFYEHRKTGETGYVAPHTEGCMLLWDKYKYFFEPKDFDLGI